eukprot:Skav231148  [mRNA]  locus=scaffold4611:65775:69738:+ [translate_table: standard]
MVEDNVRRVLKEDCNVDWTFEDVEKDLKNRMISYTGEEVAAPEILTTSQVIPALPPATHGGSVELRNWLGGKCQWYLDHPHECITEDEGQPLPPLCAKVHVEPSERRNLAQLLVERRICDWVPEPEVMRYRGTKVLNGMFGVRKKGVASCGRPILRLIMNMIPSNSVHITLAGRVGRLPNICAWGHTVCEADELVTICQSDMSAAFYLFALPRGWKRQLCFNLSFTAHELGLEDRPPEEEQFLACGVLPMGWSSAVGVMQYVAEEVLFRNNLPKDAQVRGGTPLPAWITNSQAQCEGRGQVWWHVYLDNYASGEKRKWSDEPVGGAWQHSVEDWWESAGISCSKEKSVVDAEQATELGAFISGKHRWMGASCERMLKNAKTTIWVVTQNRMKKKQVQIVMGRWIFVTQFRRPSMAQFQRVWEFVSCEQWKKSLEDEAKREMLGALMGMGLYHISFTNPVEDLITCSDASSSGGAMAHASQLSDVGHSFVASQDTTFRGEKVPIYVISLFNGIGACFRCYDVRGAILAGGLAVDIHKPGSRVTSRRWPWVDHWEDIRTLSRGAVEEILSRAEFEAIDIWAGFPCVDLSAVKWNRSNLRGSQSSLIYEAIRIIDIVKDLFPQCRVRFIVENVSSMDVTARDQISELLGVQPYKLDPCCQVPLNRPRFCWTNLELSNSGGIELIQKHGYVEVSMEAPWPLPSQWLDPESSQSDETVSYPTCMKAIRRSQPPPRPAGLERCCPDTVRRWESDEFKFPPYQYKPQYLIWCHKKEQYRLLSVQERELLMGLGLDHTSPAFSASRVKQSKLKYEDERLSLIGDSFSVWSFSIFAAASVEPWLGSVHVDKLHARMGLPPGICSQVDHKCPLSREKIYVDAPEFKASVRELNCFLACRTNHTGSDVRITTGELMNPKKMWRQSVSADWWQWQPGFKVRSRYFTAVRRLLPLLEASPADEDEVVSLWIEDQYSEGEGISYVGDALSGLHHYCPQLRGRLSKSWRLFKLWRRIEKPAQAPPFPQAFAEALIARSIELADLNLAVCLALGFFGMLRTGELLTLVPLQILVGQEDAVIQLGATKSGLRRHQDENVVIDHGPTIVLLQEWMLWRQRQHSTTAPVFEAGAHAFRTSFRRILNYFQLGSTFRPYSLRRGGATADFRAHGQMERTLIKGRWGSTQSARIYIQEGLSALVKLQLSQNQATLIQSYSAQFL